MPSAMAGWLSDVGVKEEEEKVEEDEYESNRACSLRPGYFAIHPKVLRAVAHAVEAAPNQGTPAEADAQPAEILGPQVENDWHMQFGKTDGQTWANALQPVSGNARQPLRRSTRIAKKASRHVTDTILRTLVAEKCIIKKHAIKNRLTALSLPREILCAVVEQIPDQHTLILFAITCKTFAVVAFKIYPIYTCTWIFDGWQGFQDDYDCNRSDFLLSRPLADWMPLRLKYCRHCDKWNTYYGVHRKKGQHDNILQLCFRCQMLKEKHRHHFHPGECFDLDTCARYSDWDGGTPKKKNWAKNAWYLSVDSDEEASSESNLGLAGSDDETSKDGDEEDQDEDEDECRGWCPTCAAGLSCHD